MRLATRTDSAARLIAVADRDDHPTHRSNSSSRAFAPARVPSSAFRIGIGDWRALRDSADRIPDVRTVRATGLRRVRRADHSAAALARFKQLVGIQAIVRVVVDVVRVAGGGILGRIVPAGWWCAAESSSPLKTVRSIDWLSTVR